MSDKKQTVIYDYFKKLEKIPEKQPITDHLESKSVEPTFGRVYGYNEKTNSWHCLECGDDMGPTNPRQLCGKYYCKNSN